MQTIKAESAFISIVIARSRRSRRRGNLHQSSKMSLRGINVGCSSSSQPISVRLWGFPVTPRVMGRGGAATRGQSVSNGYAYRIRRVIVSQIIDLDNSSAVALSQSSFASMLRFLGEPCMGVVSQIIDLDNSSPWQSQPIIQFFSYLYCNRKVLVLY